MPSQTLITTSWDDGHPLDLRIADLLTKYGIRGTFYVPKTAECETMTTTQIRELNSAFELGAHTLHHVVLNRATNQRAWEEICGSKAWLEEVTSAPCRLFCPPEGRFKRRHVEMIRKAGYVGFRTVEFMSLDFPRHWAGLLLLPATVQAHPNPLQDFVLNAVKRASAENLWRLIVHGRSTEWPKLAQSLLQRALKCGGVFHLRGHSWELQETGQWRQLEDILRLMGEFVTEARPLTNGELCTRSLQPLTHPAGENPQAGRGAAANAERAPLLASNPACDELPFSNATGLQKESRGHEVSE